jgi:DNA-directed RNA polymerase subunit RPC12/RpoP
MPWTAKDAQAKTARANTPKKQSTWAKIANKHLSACLKKGGSQKECEGQAVRVANQAIADIKEQEPGGPDRCVCPDCGYEVDKKRGEPCRSVTCPECGSKLMAKMEEAKMNLGELAQSAIELARVAVTDNGEITREDAMTALRGVEKKLHQVWQPGDVASIAEALTKKISGYAHPKGDFLVATGAEVGTWHLPVKKSGKPDHRLMGAAKAALTKGYRGNKYEGPNKAAALTKLKALYKSEGMEFASESAEVEEYDRETAAMIIAPTPMISFADLQAQQDAQEIAQEVRALTYQYQDLVHNIMFVAILPDRIAALRTLSDEFIGLISEKLKAEAAEAEEAIKELQEFNLCESESGAAIALEEANGADPLKLRVAVIEPGWGNLRDRHFYPAEMLKRDAHVFEGVKMYTTDHRPEEKSVRTEVSQVLKCPVGFTETGAPIALVGVFDDAFASSIRNRAALGTLDSLHCSILARGTTKTGEIGGKKANVVEAITSARSLDWITQAGAGGRALTLSESASTGGETMTDEKEKAKETETKETEVKETTLAEGEKDKGKPEAPKPEAPQPLAETEVEQALAETKLPEAFKKALKVGQYESADALKAAIEEAVAGVKNLTGSGQVFGQGGTHTAEPKRMTDKEYKEGVDEILKRHGVQLMEEV